MSLNRFTNTAEGINLELRIGAKEIKCDDLEMTNLTVENIDCKNFESENGAFRKLNTDINIMRYTDAPYVISPSIGIGVRYTTVLTDNFVTGDTIVSFFNLGVNSMRVFKSGYYKISVFVNFTTDITIDRVNVNIIRFGGDILPPPVPFGNVVSVGSGATRGGVINMSTIHRVQLIGNNTGFTLSMGIDHNVPISPNITILSWQWSITYISEL